MTTFQVNDMTCGHCARTITNALAAADPQASVSIDINAHRVEVTSASVDEAGLQRAIAAAGYTPTLVTPEATPGAAPKRGGCGCGCR